MATLMRAVGILSTTNDLSKFAVAQFEEDNTALGLTRQKTFEIDDKTAMGLGWHITHQESGDKWFWQNGRTGGYTSCMLHGL